MLVATVSMIGHTATSHSE